MKKLIKNWIYSLKNQIFLTSQKLHLTITSTSTPSKKNSIFIHQFRKLFRSHFTVSLIQCFFSHHDDISLSFINSTHPFNIFFYKQKIMKTAKKNEIILQFFKMNKFIYDRNLKCENFVCIFLQKREFINKLLTLKSEEEWNPNFIQFFSFLLYLFSIYHLNR